MARCCSNCGAPREPVLRFSSRLLLLHFCRLPLACHCLQGWDSDVIAERHHMFCKCHFAAMWDSLDVAAPGDCSSAIKPKVEHRPIFLPAIPFLVEPERMVGIDGGQVSGGTAPLTRCR